MVYQPYLCIGLNLFFHLFNFSDFSRIFLYISYTKWQIFMIIFPPISHCPKKLQKQTKFFFLERIQDPEVQSDISNLVYFETPYILVMREGNILMGYHSVSAEQKFKYTPINKLQITCQMSKYFSLLLRRHLVLLLFSTHKNIRSQICVTYRNLTRNLQKNIQTGIQRN